MSAARTERLLNLLTLLLNTRRPVSLREIRELEEFAAYQTSDPKSGERAFERDKAALIELGVPLRWVPPEQEDDEDGLGGYVVDRERYYLPELGLAPAELALLSIAGAAAAGIEGFPGRAAVIRALAKLGFDVDDARGLPALAHAPLQEGVDSARVGEHLDLLHGAIMRQQSVQLTYRGAGRDKTRRKVDPYGLYYRGGAWYLVGHCHLRGAERTFHLARIVELAAVATGKSPPHFTVPSTFDLHAHAERRPWELGQGEPMTVRVRLAARLVPAVREIFGARAELEQPAEGASAASGDVIVRLDVRQGAQLVAAVLPYGAGAEVLEPASLRAEVAQAFARLAAQYAGAGEGARP